MTDTQPAPTVPDEAVEPLAQALAMRAGDFAFSPTHANDEWEHAREAFRDSARRLLAAAAPFIVAANQPDAAEVERLRAQRDAVLAIHRRYTRYGEHYCVACNDGDGLSEESPCDTVVALAGDATP